MEIQEVTIEYGVPLTVWAIGKLFPCPPLLSSLPFSPLLYSPVLSSPLLPFHLLPLPPLLVGLRNGVEERATNGRMKQLIQVCRQWPVFGRFGTKCMIEFGRIHLVTSLIRKKPCF